MPTGDINQRFTSPDFGTQSWAGKYISHGKNDTRTKYAMALKAAQDAGIDLNSPNLDQLRGWQAKDPYWYGASQELGLIPNQQTQSGMQAQAAQQSQGMQQIQQLIKALTQGGMGQPLYSKGDVTKAENETVVPYIEKIRKDMLSNADKYGGSADVKATSKTAANTLAAQAAEAPMLATEQNNIANQQAVAQMLNRLLGSLSGANVLIGQQPQPQAAPGVP